VPVYPEDRFRGMDSEQAVPVLLYTIFVNGPISYFLLWESTHNSLLQLPIITFLCLQTHAW
jgi:hypothetical protein